MPDKMIPQTVLHPSGAETVTGQSPVLNFASKDAVYVLDVSAASGGTPTLDVTIEEYDALSGTWSVIETFTQATGVTKERKVSAAAFGNQIRAVWTIGGTTPSFTFTLSATGKV